MSNATQLFVVLPTREELAKELNEAAGCDIAVSVQAALDAYPDSFALHKVTGSTGERLVTRDRVIRLMIRQIHRLDNHQQITAAQAIAIEAVLLKYHLIWEPDKWTVDMALQLHLQRMADPA